MNNNKVIMPCAALLATLLAGGLHSPEVQADNMNFRGRLIEQQPCSVNGGENLQVDFGEVIISEINGDNYKKYIAIPFNCEDKWPKVTVKHLGLATSFDKAAVQTNIPDFGIRLIDVRDRLLPVNGDALIVFDGGKPINYSLWAVPVKKNGSELPVGDFRGVSTLQFEYP
ncbi:MULTISPECIES: fimbrial protein [unclassified Serratia (in: enterobacteria)]|uniref:fimbrial protein n=1 Tax=unclassified Serratia (in: enterobacteria) TaxID=2647522 RepID=UPI002ED15045|nr:fimbrial protein [Serratia sp. C2(2)]MEE4449667.1 fimbrial protein [Serratia sp. C2(1)]